MGPEVCLDIGTQHCNMCNSLQCLIKLKYHYLTLTPTFSVIAGGDVTSHLLSEWHTLAAAVGSTIEEVILAAADPSHVTGHVSSVLRNALLMAAVRWGVLHLRVVALRNRRGVPDADASQLITVTLPKIPDSTPSTRV